MLENKFNLLIKKIKNNIKKKININNISYFIYSFWIEITILIIILFIIKITQNYNYNFHTNKITQHVQKSKYAGNAVVINTRFFLMTNNSLDETCKITKKGQKRAIFVVFNGGNFYPVDVYKKSKIYNLAILEIKKSAKEFLNINNFVIFPNKQENLINKNVFISKTLNTDKTFYEKNKIKGMSLYGYYIKHNNFRKNYSESVLNENFEFVGLTVSNTQNKKYKFFTNYVNIINQNKIESFLKQNKIYTYKNTYNINPARANNYLKYINVKVICYVKNPPPVKSIKVNYY